MKKIIIVAVFLFSRYAYSQDTVKVASTLTPDQQAELDYNSGIEQMKKPDYLTAVDFFTKAIVSKPDFDKAFYNRAVALTKLKRYTEAYADVNKVIAKSPQNCEAIFTKSIIFFSENRIRLSESMF